MEVISNTSSFHIEEWTWLLEPETEGVVSVALFWAHSGGLDGGAQQPLKKAVFGIGVPGTILCGSGRRGELQGPGRLKLDAH